MKKNEKELLNKIRDFFNFPFFFNNKESFLEKTLETFKYKTSDEISDILLQFDYFQKHQCPEKENPFIDGVMINLISIRSENNGKSKRELLFQKIKTSLKDIGVSLDDVELRAIL